MTLEIEHPKLDTLLKELIAFTGETEPQAIVNALQERLEREKSKQQTSISVKSEILRIGRECAALPILDSRSPVEILSYDAIGMPT
ncbi:MAG: type II toxin-antitoxin system VapB family antitoxin [Chloroflexota bacterium]